MIIRGLSRVGVIMTSRKNFLEKFKSKKVDSFGNPCIPSFVKLTRFWYLAACAIIYFIVPIRFAADVGRRGVPDHPVGRRQRGQEEEEGGEGRLVRELRHAYPQVDQN